MLEMEIGYLSNVFPFSAIISFPARGFWRPRAVISIGSLRACGLQRLRATASWGKTDLELTLDNLDVGLVVTNL